MVGDGWEMVSSDGPAMRSRPGDGEAAVSSDELGTSRMEDGEAALHAQEPGPESRAGQARAMRRGGSDGPATPQPGSRAATLGVSDALYRGLRGIVHGINQVCWRVEVHGAEHVPRSGPVILAPVHRTIIDFFVVSEVTPRKIFYMAKEEIWRSARLGALVGSLGAFPVNRSGADRLALDRAKAVLDRGDVLILFPEGTRRRGPVVAEILEGAPFLAARSQAPMVPIAMSGLDRVLPQGATVPRPAKIHVVVGPPIPPPERSARGRVPRHQVHALGEALRQALQVQYDRARAMERR